MTLACDCGNGTFIIRLDSGGPVVYCAKCALKAGKLVSMEPVLREES